MIKTYNTAPTASTGSSAGAAGESKGVPTIVWVIVGGIVLYLGYRYIVKPALDKKKQEEQQKS